MKVSGWIEILGEWKDKTTTMTNISCVSSDSHWHLINRLKYILNKSCPSLTHCSCTLQAPWNQSLALARTCITKAHTNLLQTPILFAKHTSHEAAAGIILVCLTSLQEDWLGSDTHTHTHTNTHTLSLSLSLPHTHPCEHTHTHTYTQIHTGRPQPVKMPEWCMVTRYVYELSNIAFVADIGHWITRRCMNSPAYRYSRRKPEDKIRPVWDNMRLKINETLPFHLHCYAPLLSLR
jgi:hypothetical protein